MNKLTAALLLILIPAAISPAMAADAVVQERLSSYKAEGASSFDAAHGKKMWTETHTQAESGNAVSCSTCHTANLTSSGKHIRTGKVIEPMAPSVNAERLTDAAKIEKWFLRNCKWTLGRECTAQEKGDFLSYISSQ